MNDLNRSQGTGSSRVGPRPASSRPLPPQDVGRMQQDAGHARQDAGHARRPRPHGISDAEIVHRRKIMRFVTKWRTYGVVGFGALLLAGCLVGLMDCATDG